jgi:hypothetical protein
MIFPRTSSTYLQQNFTFWYDISIMDPYILTFSQKRICLQALVPARCVFGVCLYTYHIVANVLIISMLRCENLLLSIILEFVKRCQRWMEKDGIRRMDQSVECL